MKQEVFAILTAFALGACGTEEPITNEAAAVTTANVCSNGTCPVMLRVTGHGTITLVEYAMSGPVTRSCTSQCFYNIPEGARLHASAEPGTEMTVLDTFHTPCGEMGTYGCGFELLAYSEVEATFVPKPRTNQAMKLDGALTENERDQVSALAVDDEGTWFMAGVHRGTLDIQFNPSLLPTQLPGLPGVDFPNTFVFAMRADGRMKKLYPFARHRVHPSYELITHLRAGAGVGPGDFAAAGAGYAPHEWQADERRGFFLVEDHEERTVWNNIEMLFGADADAGEDIVSQAVATIRRSNGEHVIGGYLKGPEFRWRRWDEPRQGYGGQDAFILRADEDGRSSEGEDIIGGAGDDRFYDLVQASGDDFVIGGYTELGFSTVFNMGADCGIVARFRPSATRTTGSGYEASWARCIPGTDIKKVAVDEVGNVFGLAQHRATRALSVVVFNPTGQLQSDNAVHSETMDGTGLKWQDGRLYLTATSTVMTDGSAFVDVYTVGANHGLVLRERQSLSATGELKLKALAVHPTLGVVGVGGRFSGQLEGVHTTLDSDGDADGFFAQLCVDADLAEPNNSRATRSIGFGPQTLCPGKKDYFRFPFSNQAKEVWGEWCGRCLEPASGSFC